MPSSFFSTIPATTLRAWLNDGAEIALLDVREAGQFGEGHPFFAIPAPYSQLENDVPRLVPRRDARVVLLDAGDGVAERAAQQLAKLNYTQLHVLEGGAPAWAAAGYVLFQGVNLLPEVRAQLEAQGFKVAGGSSSELARSLQTEQPRYAQAIKTAGLAIR